MVENNNHWYDQLKGELKAEFEKTGQHDPAVQVANQEQQGGRDSEMIMNKQPELNHPRPDNAEAVDRAIHNQTWANEHQQAADDLNIDLSDSQRNDLSHDDVVDSWRQALHEPEQDQRHEHHQNVDRDDDSDRER